MNNRRTLDIQPRGGPTTRRIVTINRRHQEKPAEPPKTEADKTAEQLRWEKDQRLMEQLLRKPRTGK